MGTLENLLLPPPSGRTGVGAYDPKACAYNLKPSNTRRLRRGLGAVLSGTGGANISFAGTSITRGKIDGTGTPGTVAKGFVNQFRNRAALLGYTLDGSGFTTGGQGSTGLTDPRFVLGSNWFQTAGNEIIGTQIAASNAATWTSLAGESGTTLSFWYWSNQGGGTFTYSVDGGAAVTVTNSASQGVVQRIDVAVSAGAVHSIAWNNATGTNGCWIVGVQLTSGVGLSVSNIGIGGATAASAPWFQASGIQKSFSTQVVATYPSNTVAVVVEYFTNEIVGDNANSAATIAANAAAAQTLVGQGIAALQALGTIDVYLSGAIPNASAAFGAYAQAQYALADQFDIPLLDMNDRWGGPAAATTVGLYGGLHPTSAGSGDLAAAHCAFLLS